MAVEADFLKAKNTRVGSGLRSKTISQDTPQGVEQIFDPDLLALFPRSTLVTDRDLANDDLLLRKLGSYFGFKAESLLLDGNALKKLPATGFVACFHVGKLLLRHPIAQAGKYRITKAMKRRLVLMRVCEVS